VVLRQAYHPFWNAPGCDTYSSLSGNLIVDCPASRMREAPIELDFRDATSLEILASGDRFNDAAVACHWG
jgi:hypothetical protein